MKLNSLDLHGIRHHEVDLLVENFVYLNQEDMPLRIICHKNLGISITLGSERN